MSNKRITVITTGRQDWSILRPVSLALQKHPSIHLEVIAGGMSCKSTYGNVADSITEEGIPNVTACDWLSDLVPHADVFDESVAIYKHFPATLKSTQPDAVLLVGDRYETLEIATICVILNIPIIHIHGGEESEGAFDNAFRHAITKLSSLHLTSHKLHRQRVIQLGEQPDTVHIVGAPGIDNLCRDDLMDRGALEKIVGQKLPSPLILVTLHPTTAADSNQTLRECEIMLEAMAEAQASYLITLPNSDPGNELLRNRLLAFCDANDNATATEALGARGYASALQIADAMLGNSSSALLEAPYFCLPAVNIGDRQKGRLKLSNIRDVSTTKEEIIKGIEWALTIGTRDTLEKDRYELGNGNSAEKIVQHIVKWDIPKIVRKQFYQVNTKVNA